MSSTPKRFRPTPSAVIATIALVFAMTGGAYAAKKYLITSTKQISPSVLKSLKGANGKSGAAGAAGPAGPAGTAGGVGPVGAVGTAGNAGAEGKEGKEGIPGKNGKEGKEGKEGSPWTAGGVLPSGQTETGTFALDPTTGGVTRGSVSVPIPLPVQHCEEIEPGPPPVFVEQAICEDHVHVFVEGAPIPSGCTGAVVAGAVTDLQAEPGNFCAWVQFANGLTGINILDLETGGVGLGITGGVMQGAPSGAAAAGTWAVTAP